jgi:hypothetical protein
MNSSLLRRATARQLAVVALTLASASTAKGAEREGPLRFALGKASECATCHAAPNPPGRENELPHAAFAWQTSMMGLAARDPVFWAALAIAAQDAPEHTPSCVRCHAPRAYWEGFDNVVNESDLRSEDREGISCDICHRMQVDESMGPGNANYAINDEVGAMGMAPPKNGPWAYAASDVLMHDWAEDLSVLGSSRACGSCHDVTTSRPRVDAAGNEMGHLFNEQRTYSEWLNSAFGPGGAQARSCQDCHMPKLENVAGCKAFQDEGRWHATGGRAHTLAGANRFIVGVLKDELGAAGADVLPDSYFDATIAAIDATLASAAHLSIEAPAQHAATSEPLSANLEVINRSGHKLPTGYSEGRTMWVEFTVRYGDSIVFQSGQVDADGQLIDDPQLRSYEAIAEDADNGSVFHLLRSNRWRLDSRLPPQGLKADPQTDPVGDRYALQPDGTWPNFDRFAYRVDLIALSDRTPWDTNDDFLQVEARLLYRVNTPDYVKFLADANETNQAGLHAKFLFDARDGSPAMELARAQATVQVLAFEDHDTSATSSESSTSGSTNASSDSTKSSMQVAGEGGCPCNASASRECWSNILVPTVVLFGSKRRRRRRAPISSRPKFVAG